MCVHFCLNHTSPPSWIGRSGTCATHPPTPKLTNNCSLWNRQELLTAHCSPITSATWSPPVTDAGFLPSKQRPPRALLLLSSPVSTDHFPSSVFVHEPQLVPSPGTSLVGSRMVSGAHVLQTPSSLHLLSPALIQPGQTFLAHLSFAHSSPECQARAQTVPASLATSV